MPTSCKALFEVARTPFEAGRMLLFRRGDRLALHARPGGARLLLLGGAVMDGPRHVFWNFVSSSSERIKQAEADWKAGRFGAVAGDEHEFIPNHRGADRREVAKKRQKIRAAAALRPVRPDPGRANRRSSLRARHSSQRF